MGKPVGVMAIALTVLAATSVTTPVQAESVEVEMPTGMTQCSFSAWTSFHGDAPVPIRVEPSETAAILGYALASNGGGDDAISAEFDVTEARSGWLKIEHQTIELPEGADKSALSPPPYEGAGWIPSGAAQIGIQSALGYARPDADSPLIIDLGGEWLTDVASIDAIRACSGGWLLVDYRRDSEPGSAADFYDWPADRPDRGTAWFRGVCSNQRTTCDMASVDRRP